MAGELGLFFNEAGKALCPFHNDTDPSLGLYEGNDGVQRFHCFPCGADGDCYDLIQRLRGVSFPDAINEADAMFDSMPPTWHERIAVTAPTGEEASVLLFADYVDDARQRAHDPVNHGTVCVVAGLLPLDADDLERRQADEILRKPWNWGVDSDGNLLLPHWTEEGEFTAVKVRAMDGRKWGKKGNRFPELYGSWIPRRYKQVLLCEGETDCGWAALQEADVDIRALPAGAGTLRERYLEQLSQWELVYLALDPDRAGIKATRNLIAALGVDKVRVCTLPRGKDLRDVRPNLERLLSNAVEPPVDASGLITVNGVFERIGTQQNRQLTSWVAEPSSRLIPGEEDEDLDTAFEIDISWAGHTRSEILRARDLNSASRLKSWLFTKNLDWMGGDSDVNQLQAWMNNRSAILPEVFQTARLGIHKAPREFGYAGRTLVLPDGHIGTLPWKFANDDVSETDVLYSAERQVGPPNYDWLLYLLNMHNPQAMCVILSWFALTTRRTDVKDFPLLFIGGPSGSGKSATAQLLCRMFGSSLGYHLGNATAFTIMKMLSSTTTIPIFLDEWSRQSRQDARDAVRAAIPHIYEGGVVPRGTREQTVNKYRCTAPVVIAGEDSFRLDRERDRMVTVELTRAGQNAAYHAWLTQQPLERFGYWFNRWVIETPHLTPLPAAGQAPDRPTYAKQLLTAGWEMIKDFLGDAQYAGAQVPDIGTIDLGMLDKQEASRVNEYEELLLAALGQVDASGVDLVWEDEEGTWVRFPAITSQSFLSRLDITPPGDSSSMRRYFESLGYPITSARKSPPFAHKMVRAHCIHGYHLEDK